MQPLVSVIIPTFNCEKYIAETVGSVLAQDYKNIEIIIVDDGSTDNTVQIIKQCSDNIRLITQINSGVCRARNKGISEAKGDYICLMDHDDYWFPDKISTQVKLFESSPEAGVIYSEFILWHPDKNGVFPQPSSFKDLVDINDKFKLDKLLSGWIYHQLLLDCWVLTSTAMIRSDLFSECGLFDESLPYSEDWDLWLRFSVRYPFFKLCMPTTLYRQHVQQGNKKLRSIDYRTQLISNSRRRWGLCSPDGRCLTEWQYRKQLSNYHASFGLYHLNQNGSLTIAISSFAKAWCVFPVKFKYLAYIVASLLGWRPQW